MAKDALASYLNDHLAGSAAALELLEKMRAANAGNEVGKTVAELHEAIKQDRASLETIMQTLDVGVSSLRQAGGQVVGKVSRVGIRRMGHGRPRSHPVARDRSPGARHRRQDGRLVRFEELPASRLNDVDLDGLIGRARQQRETVEKLRRDAARAAFV